MCTPLSRGCGTTPTAPCGRWGHGCMPTCGTGVYYCIPIPSGPLLCRCGRWPDDMRALLAEADLVVAKGDANYRRALGDAHWPWTTPFVDIVSYFPTPLAFLRTCKAEVIA